jgi:toxin-antitoxin system PIN domain toxin
MRALLDVNVLLALFDQEHSHSQRANAWMSENAALGWASSPLTENGFVRIVSQPSYANRWWAVDAARLLLVQEQASDHEFWPDEISIADRNVFDHTRILGPNQVTDVYLLALAVKHDGRFVTFDRGIPLSAVRGAESRHLVVV